jgi:hypothetical protein
MQSALRRFIAGCRSRMAGPYGPELNVVSAVASTLDPPLAFRVCNGDSEKARGLMQRPGYLTLSVPKGNLITLANDIRASQYMWVSPHKR